MDKDNVKRVEPTPEVNIYLNKPFVSDNRREQSGKDQGFQQMLDDSIAELKKSDKLFTDAVNDLYEDALINKAPLTPRQIQIIELIRTRNRLKSMSIANELEREMEQEIHLKH